MIGRIKNAARKIGFLRNIYSKLIFLRHFPFLDILRFGKRRLIRTVKPYSLLQYQTLSKIYALVSGIVQKGTPGDFVECGVCNGGLSGLVSSLLLKDAGRSAWLFDSWEGLPEPRRDLDITVEGVKGEKGMALGSMDRVKELLFRRLQLDSSRIHLVKGWFNDTLPKTKGNIKQIAFMHLDGDLYDSIKEPLEQLYDRVVSGGVICVDDYDCYLGCKKAVDEFVQQRGIQARLTTIPFTTTYFVKP